MVKKRNYIKTNLKTRLRKFLYIIFYKVHSVLSKLKIPKIIQNEIIDVIIDFLAFIIPNNLKKKIIVNKSKIKYFCSQKYIKNKSKFRKNYQILKYFVKIILRKQLNSN